MAVKTQVFQPSSSNLGATIMQSFNMIRGKDVSNFSLYFLDATSNKRAGEEQSFFMPNIVIGRGSKCHVKYGDNYSTVSREHASISSDGKSHFLNHNPSAKNPTFVNGRPIGGTHMLQSGDEIQFSHNGPKARFVSSNQVKSSTIGVTSRIGSAVGQALKPYKTAVKVLGVLLIGSLGLGAYTMYQNQNLKTEIADAKEVMSFLDEEIKGKQAALEKIKNQNSVQAQKLKNEIGSLGRQLRDVKNKPAEVVYKYIPNPSSSSIGSKSFTYNPNLSKPSNPISDKPSGDGDKSSKTGSNDKSTTGLDQGWDIGEDNGDGVSNLNLELVDPNLLPKGDIHLLLCKRIEVSYNGKTEVVGAKKFYQYDVQNSRNEDRNAIFLGTGFSTEDKKLYTARHLAQPWRFPNVSQNAYFDSMMEELNILEANGADITLIFDSFSQNGKEHSFNTNNMRVDDSADEFVETGEKKELKLFQSLKKGGLFKSGKVDMKFKRSTEPYSDWAKISFDNMDSEIKTSRPKSVKLRTGTELHVLGFSHGNMTQTSNKKVEPLYSKTMVAQDYTFDGIINTSGLNFGTGNSGGPALLYEDGQFIAVGLVSGGVGTSNGVIVPIQNIQ